MAGPEGTDSPQPGQGMMETRHDEGAVMTFDPYSAWLGLPPGPRPPDPYTLLGVARFECDPHRVAAAAAERVRLINRKAPFDRGDEMREVLDEIASAERVLCDPVRRRRLELEVRASEKRRPRPAAPHRSKTPAVAAASAAAGKPAPRDEPAPARRALWAIVSGGATAVVLLIAGWLAWPTGKSDRAGGAVTTARAEVPGRGSGAVTEAVPDPLPASPPTRPPVQATKPTGPAATEALSAAPVQDPEPRATAAAFALPTVAPVEARKPLLSSFVEYRPPVFMSEVDRAAYSRHVRDLLYEAFTLKGDPATLAEHFRQADALSPNHPFTGYAAAIAFWKRLRFREAEAHLRAALGSGADPFHPARRASIRMHLSRNRRSEALKEAVGFAEAMDAGDGVENHEASDASTRWLGRLIAALESPWVPNAAPKDLAEADAAIRAVLGPDAEAAYEAGRRSLRDDYAARAAAVEAEIADLSLDHETRRAETLDKIAEDRDAAEDEREEATRTAAGWKQWLDEQTKGLDEELKKLETAHQQLTVQAEAAAATYLTLAQEITNRQARAELADAPLGVGVNTAQLAVASNQALAELKLLNGRIAEVRGQAQALLTKRQGIVARYEKETKTLTAKTDALRKWEGILKRRADETDAEEVTDVPAAKTLRRRLRDLDTYLPFDLGAEQDAVLGALRD